MLENPIRATMCLNKYAQKCGLTCPECFNSTNLKKANCNYDDEESVLIDIKTPEAPTEKTADSAVCKIEPYLILESSFRNLKNGNELSDDIVNSAVYPATQKREFSMSLLILKEGHLAKVMLFSLRLHLV
ncbi:uncharacterized protein LOC144342484 [Saccoglossus kowalevskii]